MSYKKNAKQINVNIHFALLNSYFIQIAYYQILSLYILISPLNISGYYICNFLKFKIHHSSYHIEA